MTRKPVPEVPYSTRTGHMITFPDYQYEWRTNEPFEAALRIVGTERGRSAARFIAENTETGVQYPLFMTDLLVIVQTATIEQGIIFGQWIAGKRGSNYGIRLVTQECR